MKLFVFWMDFFGCMFGLVVIVIMYFEIRYNFYIKLYFISFIIYMYKFLNNLFKILLFFFNVVFKFKYVFCR